MNLLLAIETSCDETAAAILAEQAGRPHLLSNVVATQHEFHARFGGIVPEIAARRHAEILEAIIADALERAAVGFDDLSAVAVVHGPGLIGSLVVGVSAAKAIAFAKNLPLIGVNHLEAHIYSIFLPEAGEMPSFPLLVLIASGGHTHLVLMKEHGKFQVVGRTRDDAAGEAFDKAGKLLDLGYPGGPALAALAEKGKAGKIAFPIAEMEASGKGRSAWDFSFSGTKAALARHVRGLSPEELEQQRADLAAGFQRAVVSALVETTLRAAEELEVNSLAIAGGVASNLLLREELAKRAHKIGLDLFVPPGWLCTDNAAMVGAAAYYKMAAGLVSGLDLDCESSLPLIDWK